MGCARLNATDKEQTTHGQELEDLREEVARLSAEVDRHRQGALEEIARRESRLSMRQEEVTKQHTALKRRIKELDIRQAKVALGSRELACCRQKLETQLQKVQHGLIEGTHGSLGIRCTVKEELIETVQSTWEMLAPRAGEILTHQQSRCILQLNIELLLAKRNVADTELLVSQDCETRLPVVEIPCCSTTSALYW